MILLSEKEEAYLIKIIESVDNDNEYTMSNTSEYDYFCNNEKKYAVSLDSKGLINLIMNMAAVKISLTADGESYFEMKEKELQKVELNKPQINNIFTGDNSPVNINQGSGTATQNIDYANSELINALTTLTEMIALSSQFTKDEQEEIIELIDGAKEASQNSKQTLLKATLNGLESLLMKAPSFVVTHWEQIKSMVGL